MPMTLLFTPLASYAANNNKRRILKSNLLKAVVSRLTTFDKEAGETDWLCEKMFNLSP